MSYADAVSRIAAIDGQLAAARTAFAPPAAAAAAPAGATPSPTATAGAGTPSTSFATALAQAQAPAPALSLAPAPAAGPAAQNATLPPAATTTLTSGQQQFAARLAQDTGLSPQVVSAWLLAEESGGAAATRQSSNNNDWLNIGYTDSGTYGASDGIWSDPLAAADATAGWLRGQSTIPGYGTASAGIQAILATAGQPPSAQVSAIQQSGWASSGYPDLPGLAAQMGA